MAFFDGFYFERTTAPGGNEGLTSGQARGEVVRGTLIRDDSWSAWLSAVHRPFRKEIPRIDIEFARDAQGWILLQVRPALFPVVRNETLSLANHKEILGDPPSPWITSVVVAAGREVLSYFAAADPEVGRWEESYAIPLAARAWMNFSFFFRLMDHWGLPRTFVTEGVGGEGGGPADHRLLLGRFLRKSPRLVRLQIQNLENDREGGRGACPARRASRRRLGSGGSPPNQRQGSGAGDPHELRHQRGALGSLAGAARPGRPRDGEGDDAGDDGGVRPARGG